MNMFDDIKCFVGLRKLRIKNFDFSYRKLRLILRIMEELVEWIKNRMKFG